ncbi:MAG: ABC transporter ATP-binding protein [Clostridiales bacterium]|uniref:ABC transport system ATP-binding protein n=1 Tax=Harryflintia acetispora TaxID=1849041 RepID=A0A9X8UL20_9FIRM|nr:ATP-binding cassette domain-containing protein [Harryflintia acetispora]PWM36803.1 MAG: ABC transporter ATP-binding protein [Clostridiales bacterium]RGB69716.1 ATP-binding cassette domain-containing protein [Harryflintia acetispora]TCL44544.1 putative ABC transport system ATP-binding protein [Harryflintia acetispora]
MLEISGLQKVFGRGTVNERVAIKDFSLSLQKGDFVTIIGGNGAGKSTLFNLIAGTYLPDGGKILLDGEDITFQREYLRAQHIGRLFQDPLKGTAPSMTLEENLALAYGRGTKRGFSIGIPKRDAEMFCEKLRALGLGLEDRMKTRMGLLSGGQRQAVTLLMATIVTPKLLLLDEHTAALDPSTAQKVLELTQRIVREHGITTMMITHNIGSSLELGNRTIMMDEGSLILDLKGEERANMTVPKLLEVFREKSRKELDNDRMLLS